MKRLSLAIFVGILQTAVCIEAHAAGTSAFDFLRADVSARAAALGGSFLTITDDPNILFYNPAGLSSLSGRKVSFGYFKHLLDINSGYASYASELPGFGFVGAGVEYINYGEFKRTGEEGQDLGTFGAGELALVAGYGGEMQSGLHYGANVKYIYSSIAETHSSAVALDFGLQYIAIPSRLLIGASLLNLGTQLNPYIATREQLPTDFSVGASIYPEHLPVVLIVSLHKLNDQYDSFSERMKVFSVGAEFTASSSLSLRMGYNNERRRDLNVGSGSGLAGFSAGGGIASEMYTFDYAYNSYGPVGGLHRISVLINF
jgi:hypothetical protein